jgi:periplasmic protein CpxP/Spy
VRSRLVFLASVALLAGARELSAQVPQRQRQQLPQGEGAPGRTALERQVQQQLWRLTRQRVGLSDAQMRQLVPVNQRFETRRRQILREERETRLALRGAVLDSVGADDARVSAQIDRLLQLERERIDLVQEEQRELSRFMTPLQRARYMALQEQVRRRVEQMRRREQRR